MNKRFPIPRKETLDDGSFRAHLRKVYFPNEYKGVKTKEVTRGVRGKMSTDERGAQVIAVELSGDMFEK